MSYPVDPVTLPSALACGSRNGQLAPSKLVDIGHGGRLEATAARCWAALWVAAKAAGHDLTWTPGGTYRTFDNQVAVFLQRMQTTPVANRSDAGQPVYVTRFYMGQVWYLRPGEAMVATPGTSNHGLGLAIDTATGDDPATALGIGLPWAGDPAPDAALSWLLAETAPYPGSNAQSCGFSWEAQSEPWHLRYCTGDTIPQRVLDIEAWFAGQAAPSV